MSSLGSPSPSRSKGSEWTYTLYFTPDADNPGGSPIEITHSNLISYFSEVDGNDDQILEVWIYKQNLSVWMPKWFGLWHEFTVVESTNWYWSFEKDSSGLCVQRSKKWDSVQKSYRRTKRTGTVVSEGRESRKGRDGDKMIHVFNFIYQQMYLKRGYHVTKANCHYFASVVYEAVARRAGRELPRDL